MEQNGSLGRLTPRELEVLGAMATGTTNSAIANQLYLSKRGVEKHIEYKRLERVAPRSR